MTATPAPRAKDALKPCPFCGSCQAFPMGPTCTRTTPYSPADRAYPIVRCLSCYAEAAGKDWDETGRSAIAAWNRRITEIQQEATRDAG